mmetsp:Transcript_53257/g.108661  ORF Transcript_53257/g.108661 Transcript_53257/m.108661 type:complete len:97 (+) Transcript_53257:62-352(+)
MGNWIPKTHIVNHSSRPVKMSLTKLEEGKPKVIAMGWVQPGGVHSWETEHDCELTCTTFTEDNKVSMITGDSNDSFIHSSHGMLVKSVLGDVHRPR